jgi:hypothetical protein
VNLEASGQPRSELGENERQLLPRRHVRLSAAEVDTSPAHEVRYFCPIHLTNRKRAGHKGQLAQEGSLGDRSP